MEFNNLYSFDDYNFFIKVIDNSINDFEEKLDLLYDLKSEFITLKNRRDNI